MDKELDAIYNGFKTSLSPPPPAKDQKKAWLDFLSQKEIATTPVSFQAVETPNGKSWGANVTFAGIMNEAKGVHRGSGGMEAMKEVVSSRLQDYAIGLHEDKKIIDQNQTSELISMFQDKNSINYFLENYKTIDDPSLNTKNEKPLKIKPTVGQDMFHIQGGGNPEYDGSAGQNGLANLRSIFDETVDISIARSSEIDRNARVTLGRTENGGGALNALRKDEKFLSIFDKNSYEGTWDKLAQTYNENTQFSQRNMSSEQTEAINKTLSTLILEAQINCTSHIKEKMEKMEKIEKLTGEKKPKVLDYSEPQM